MPLPIAFFFSLTLLTLGCRGLKIETKDEFIRFIERMNKGNSFGGVTVLLMNDIDMGDYTYTTDSNSNLGKFKGTFDGQGYKIDNLTIESSLNAAGLFSTAIDAELKNIVLADSCAINYNASNVIDGKDNLVVGGIAGLFSADDKPCTIENSVSMTKMTLSGESGSRMLLVGGISGYGLGKSDKILIKNSVYLGTIDLSGVTCGTYVGSITGGIGGDFIQSQLVNCNNAGNILFNGTQYPQININIGGIVGYAYKCNVSNCVNGGKIEINSNESNVGEIAALASQSTIEYCYFDKSSNYPDVPAQNFHNSDRICVRTYDEDYILNTSVTIGKYEGDSLIEALNSYVDLFKIYNYKRWVLNKEGHSFVATTKKFNKDNERKLWSALVLLPDLADRGSFHFDGWYTDTEMKSAFDKTTISANTIIYGSWTKWEKYYTVSFNHPGVGPITKKFGEVVSLPRGIKNDASVLGGWIDKHGEYASWNYTILPYDVTLNPVWIKTVLSTPDDFSNFTKFVNSGVDCKDLTIFLNDDIDMEGAVLEPIGRLGKPFLGTLDGQGHVIRNLKIVSNAQDVGLIGYSNGMTVRNIVLDSGCVVESTYESQIEEEHVICVGGFVGYCYTKDHKCVAENLVGLGLINKTNPVWASEVMLLGGIVGFFRVRLYAVSVVNCAFYGTQIYSGNCISTYIGGIIGKCSGMLHSSSACQVVNCMADNNITASGEVTEYLDIGGVAGNIEANSVVKNSIWTGVVTLETNSSGAFIGAIVGFMWNSMLESCYWYESNGYGAFSNTKGNTEAEKCSSYDKDANVEELSTVGFYVGHSLINSLIAFTLEDRSLSRWTLNANNNTITYIIKENDKEHEIFSTSSRIALLPEFADSEERRFSGWYNDPTFESPFVNNILYSNITLYGKWESTKKKYTATFIKFGNNVYTKRISPGDRVYPHLKEGKRGGYDFVHWKNSFGKILDERYLMPAQDMVFTAVWLKKRISTPKDLLEFSDIVNSGAKCDGKTVFLDSDIDFDGVAESFNPIGNNANGFSGVFDGQGYRISNMKITANITTQYYGLFGVSFSGAEIRNVVVDPTCSVASSCSYTYAYIGGILGYCLAGDRDCKVVNAINFAGITANGENHVTELNMGGIVGECKNNNYTCRINNCANYGNLKNEGTYLKTFMGGIIGVYTGNTYTSCFITNNLNYGNISHTGTTVSENWLDIGGIIGMTEGYNRIVGCISMGNISTNQASSCVRSISGNTNTFMSYDGSQSSTEASGVTDNFWSEEVFYGDYTGSNPEIQGGFNLSDGDLLSNRLKNTTADNFLMQTNYENKEIEYKSMWLLNEGMHNVTFRLSNKNRNVISYASKIILAPTLLQSTEYRFRGWNFKNGIRKNGEGLAVVYEDTVLYAKWDGKHYLNMIAVINVSVVAGIIALVLSVVAGFYVRGYRESNRKKKVIRDMVYPKVYDELEPENSINLLEVEELYPSDYKRPEMMDALVAAGIDETTARDIVTVSYENAYKLADSGKLGSRLTEDDAAAIAMYTFELGSHKYKMNPYRLINDALASKSLDELRKVRDLLYLVMTALRKLPVVYGIDFHRGIRDDISDKLQDNNFDKISNSIGDRMEGDTKSKYNYAESVNTKTTWDTLSSTSPSMSVTKAFLAKKKGGNVSGTLFIVSNGWGYDISPYSLFPGEAEILLEPERQFKVVSVIPAELTIVRLEMLKSPIILPGVFGVHKTRASFLYFLKYISGDKRGDRRDRLAKYLQKSDENSDISENPTASSERRTTSK